MSLTILTLFIILAFFSVLMQWHRIKWGILVGAITLFTLTGTGLLPKYLLEKVQGGYAVKSDVVWGLNNAIVLLGGGTQQMPGTPIVEPTFFSYSRIEGATAQYYRCLDHVRMCKIIVSGGDASHHGVSEAAVYKKHLIALGIDRHSIITEPDSMNTWQNAQLTSEIIKAEGFDNIVLVSSGVHMRRSELYFNHFGVAITPVRSDYLMAVISLMPIGYNFTVTDFVLHEMMGYLRYDIYHFMGWNNEIPAEDA